MPAVVRDIRSLPALPEAVYIDTSVLFGAYLGGAGGTNSHELACAAFLKAAAASNRCDAWTSLLAIEEACWVLLRNALFAAVPKRGMALAEFKRHHPAEYTRAYKSARLTVDPVMAFLMTLGVAVRGPAGPRAHSARAHRAICFAVRCMFHQYELEMADLFHIAIAKLDGTHAIATLDTGFEDVDGIEVYTCPRTP